MGGSADDLKRLPYKGHAPNSPTVSWHRSVTDKEVHRRPPLSNIFPTAAPSPRCAWPWTCGPPLSILHIEKRNRMVWCHFCWGLWVQSATHVYIAHHVQGRILARSV